VIASVGGLLSGSLVCGVCLIEKVVLGGGGEKERGCTGRGKSKKIRGGGGHGGEKGGAPKRKTLL